MITNLELWRKFSFEINVIFLKRYSVWVFGGLVGYLGRGELEKDAEVRISDDLISAWVNSE